MWFLFNRTIRESECDRDEKNWSGESRLSWFGTWIGCCYVLKELFCHIEEEEDRPTVKTHRRYSGIIYGVFCLNLDSKSCYRNLFYLFLSFLFGQNRKISFHTHRIFIISLDCWWVYKIFWLIISHLS